MKAILLRAHGGPESLEYSDFDAPGPGRDEVLVRVRATSVNRADTVVRRGYPGLTISLPHILGGDISGEIEALGPDVSGWKPADRVVCYPMVLDGGYAGDEFWRVGWQYFGMHRMGSYAELVSVPAQCLVPLPAHVRFEEAACLPVAGLTAEHALNVGEITQGSTLFFWGGSGGLGTLLIPLARRRGARVITTASTPDKQRMLHSLGADFVLSHTSDNVPAEVQKIAPGGVDVVLDYVGPTTFGHSFAMLRKGGTLLWCGMITGREVTVNIQATYVRHLSIRGLYLGSRREMDAIVGHLAAGDLRPHIHATLPLSQARRAHEMLESGEVTGKVVLVP
jgi:NADPH:quinone reductase-like Zn-dependent oxidoreductase